MPRFSCLQWLILVAAIGLAYYLGYRDGRHH